MAKRHFLGTVAALGLMANGATAQQIINLEEVTFSVSRVPLELGRTGARVQVLTREDIEEANETEVNTVLSRLPGVTMTQRGPIGASGSVRIRGADERYFPVLINGINMSDPSQLQSQFSFAGLTSSAVSRLEVLKGSQSAIYGSNAIAGVVNLTMGEIPDEVGSETKVTTEFGSFNTRRLGLSYGQRFERGEVAFTFERALTDGFSSADENDGNTEDDGFRSTILSFRARHELTDTVAVGASAFYQDSFNEFDAGAGVGGDDPNRFGLSERYGLRGFVEFALGAVENEISIETSRNERADPNAPTTFTTTDFQGGRTGIQYNGRVDLSGNSTLVFGAQYQRETYDAFRPGGASFDGTIRRNALFAEYLYAPTENIDLTFALRREDDSRFGGQITGRAAFVWRPDAATVVRASAGTGFRAPSANEMFGPFGANPNLKPEESESFDIGVSREFGAFKADVALFRTDIDNLIGYTTGYVQIAGRSRLQGVEMSGTYDISDNLSLSGAYTFTDAKDRSGNPVGNVPKHDLAVSVDWKIMEGLRNTTTLAASSERFGFGGSSIPGFGVVNTNFSYDLTERAQLTFRVENIFNKQYQTVEGYGTSDRAFYLGLSSRF